MGTLMQGKVVVVTGAGNGIGRDIALAMAAEGAEVVVNDIGASLSGEGQDTSCAQQVVTEIEHHGGKAVASTDSVASWPSAQRIVSAALDSFGRIDCVVNNAGILRDKFIFNMPIEDWQKVLDVHLHGSFYMARAASAHFKNAQRGSFVNMTSTSGLIGNYGQANYMAAKLGIAGLSRSLALDLAKFDVRSNCIAPFAWSRMISSIPTDTPDQVERVNRLKTMETAKVAPLAVYLASDLASEITGQIFAVRANEIFLFSQPRPVRSVHNSEGWTPERIASQAIPAMRAQLTPLERSQDVFSWDPI